MPSEQTSATGIEQLLASKPIPDVQLSEDESHAISQFGKNLADEYVQAELAKLTQRIIEPRAAALKAIQEAETGHPEREGTPAAPRLERSLEPAHAAEPPASSAGTGIQWCVITREPPYLNAAPEDPDLICQNRAGIAMGFARASREHGTIALGAGVGVFSPAIDADQASRCDADASDPRYQSTQTQAGIQQLVYLPAPLPADGLVTASCRVEVDNSSWWYGLSPGPAGGGFVGLFAVLHLSLFTAGAPAGAGRQLVYAIRYPDPRLDLTIAVPPGPIYLSATAMTPKGTKVLGLSMDALLVVFKNRNTAASGWANLTDPLHFPVDFPSLGLAGGPITVKSMAFRIPWGTLWPKPPAPWPDVTG